VNVAEGSAGKPHGTARHSIGNSQGDGIAADRTGKKPQRAARAAAHDSPGNGALGKVRGDERIERDFNTTTWSRTRSDKS
jgi:hypothetical protein